MENIIYKNDSDRIRACDRDHKILYDMDLVFGIYPSGHGRIIKTRGLGMNQDQVLELFATYITALSGHNLDLIKDGIKKEVLDFLSELADKYSVVNL